MEFVVRALPNRPDTLEVRYNCECGCKPRARYQRGSSEAGHEHCCCGRVHFVGARAQQQLQAYLAERQAHGEDADLKYAIHAQEVKAPWGEAVPVAYALPDNPRKH
ncbi:MAG: hypothetical protein HY686_03180 [Chloroflexi bacterium]|nr:hypothetical protein [Chloroflexota bacterium]